MDFSEARKKYLHKIVLHREKPFLFEIASMYKFNGEIKASFRHLHYRDIPIGQMLAARLEELEKDFKIIG